MLVNGSTAKHGKLFLWTGLLLGTLVSGWYLYCLHGPSRLTRLAVPESVGTQFVNIGLIYFAAIVQCRLIFRLFRWLMGRFQANRHDH
ncbi:hypothetical protein [Geobacter argillaceus]|uniref:Uncharacterized protein n=1 Tax=Geobacter argillaceus TaxID=345631 RepID=A0A562VJ53_9BACT|nr:hypothetical protein [Geobacter argillaceus]TWJ17767.1 hypothetical protein JN12_02884 [Geobacter argillaceus]